MRQKIKKGCCVAGETDRAAAAAGSRGYNTHILGATLAAVQCTVINCLKCEGGLKGLVLQAAGVNIKVPFFNCATVCSSGHHGRRKVLLQPHRRPPLCSPYSHCILLQPTHYFASTGFSFVLSTQFTFITILYLKQKTLQIFLSSYLE